MVLILLPFAGYLFSKFLPFKHIQVTNSGEREMRNLLRSFWEILQFLIGRQI